MANSFENTGVAIMINRTVSVVCIALGVALAGSALAASQQECRQLRGRGAGSTEIPPNPVVLMLFECSGMAKDIEALDVLDRDMMVMRAKGMPLKKLRGQQTDSNPPRKYSELTSAARLAKFKRLVVAYFKPTGKSPPKNPPDCPVAGCVMMHCPPPAGPVICCNQATHKPC